MSDRRTDPNPDSRPRDEDRGSIEAIDRPEADRGSEDAPDAMNGAVGGTDGVIKNQDATAQ